MQHLRLFSHCAPSPFIFVVKFVYLQKCDCLANLVDHIVDLFFTQLVL